MKPVSRKPPLMETNGRDRIYERKNYFKNYFKDIKIKI